MNGECCHEKVGSKLLLCHSLQLVHKGKDTIGNMFNTYLSDQPFSLQVQVL